jgi:parvulin-like peptidyl-prolyl isomerase
VLKKLRNKKTAKWIWIGLAILIVPAFLLWGLGSAIRSRGEATGISNLEYKDALDAVKNMAIMQFGDKFSEIQKYLNLESQAWERLLLLRAAKKRKINATDKEVIKLIESYPLFQRKGQFDNGVYSGILQYYFRTQARVFEEQTRQNIILSKLYRQVTDNIKVSEEEIKKEYRRLNEEISIYYIASLPSDFSKDITASEEELKDYFAKNSFEFKQPLSFNIEYLSVNSEDKIKDIRGRLNKSKDFSKVAKDKAVEVKETGLFTQTDSIPGIGWSPQILSLIPQLKLGQFSAPIHLDKNYYILRLKERKEPYIPDLAAIKDKVKETFIKNKAKKIAKNKIEDCLKVLKETYSTNPKSINLEKIAKTCGLKSDSTDFFKYGSYIEGTGASDSFWTAAQELKDDDEFSNIIDVPSGFYIIKLKSKIPIDQKKFESERLEFNQKLLQQLQQEYFAKFIEELKRKAQ